MTTLRDTDPFDPFGRVFTTAAFVGAVLEGEGWGEGLNDSPELSIFGVKKKCPR